MQDKRRKAAWPKLDLNIQNCDGDILLYNCFWIRSGCGVARTQFPRLQKWCSWPAPIWILVMPLHSTGVQWSAPWQGHAWLIARSPLPGKYEDLRNIILRRILKMKKIFMNVGPKKRFVKVLENLMEESIKVKWGWCHREFKHKLKTVQGAFYSTCCFIAIWSRWFQLSGHTWKYGHHTIVMHFIPLTCNEPEYTFSFINTHVWRAGAFRSNRIKSLRKALAPNLNHKPAGTKNINSDLSHEVGPFQIFWNMCISGHNIM